MTFAYQSGVTFNRGHAVRPRHKRVGRPNGSWEDLKTFTVNTTHIFDEVPVIKCTLEHFTTTAAGFLSDGSLSAQRWHFCDGFALVPSRGVFFLVTSASLIIHGWSFTHRSYSHRIGYKKVFFFFFLAWRNTGVYSEHHLSKYILSMVQNTLVQNTPI